MKKAVIILIVLAILGGAGYWYADYKGWLDNYGPDNLPTAEERQRMEEVEKSAGKIAPDAKAGAGVRLKGSTPTPTPEQATSTGTTTIEATSTSSSVGTTTEASTTS